MKLIDNLKEKFEEGVSSFKVRGEIAEPTWAEISVTNTTGNPVALGTPPADLKIRIQTLASGAEGFSAKDYRIDNSHNSDLHQHFLGSTSPVNVPSLSGALLMILGSDYWALERKS